MDIKVLCACGAKYQFPVEPVEGRLPHSIACPVCGADNTEAGNAAIQAKLASEPARIPTATPLASPTAMPIARPANQGRATEGSEAPVRPFAPGSIHAQRQTQPGGTGARAKAKRIWSLTVTAVLVCVGAYALYTKWSKRVGSVTDLVKAISSGQDTESSGSQIRWTLPDDDAGVMLIKHSDHTNVARAFAMAYGQATKQVLNITPATEEYDEEANFAVYPAQKGAVSIMGPMEWPEPQASTLAAALSKQLSTIVVLALMGDDAESGMVSIYENGERRFMLKRWYQITSLSEDGLKEFMEREGEAWAKEHGYLPSPAKVLTGDTDAVPFEDVNDLVLKLGIDTSEIPEEIKGVLLLKHDRPKGM